MTRFINPYVNYPPALQEAYQNDLKAYRDNVNVLETARIEGEATGEARGEARGRAEGEAQKALEIARSMKRKGYATDDIVEITGLSSAEIERLD